MSGLGQSAYRLQEESGKRGILQHSGISIVAAVFLTGLALSGDGVVAPMGFVVALFFAAAIGGLIEIALRSGLLIVATLVLTAGMAFANGLASAASSGVVITKVDARAGAEAVQLVVLLVLIFQGTLLGVCALGARKLALPVTQPDGQIGSAIWIFFSATLIAALMAGTWTYYGGDRVEVAPGAFQLDYLYLPTLLGVFASSLRGRGKANGLVSAALFLLIFATQMRRLMVTATILGAISMLRRQHFAWAKVGIAGLVALLLVSAGSAAWRRSSEEFSTNDVLERVTDAARRVGELEGIVEGFKERAAVFMWLDAIAVEQAPKLQGTISMTELFTTTAWVVVPGALAPRKYDIEQISCETSLSLVGLSGLDLPCTPEAEAYLAAGIPGVLGLAVLWGVFLLAIESLCRRCGLGSLLAMHLFFFCSYVETSAFPQILGLRSAALTFLLVAPLAALLTASRPLRNVTSVGSHQVNSAKRDLNQGKLAAGRGRESAQTAQPRRPPTYRLGQLRHRLVSRDSL